MPSSPRTRTKRRPKAAACCRTPRPPPSAERRRCRSTCRSRGARCSSMAEDAASPAADLRELCFTGARGLARLLRTRKVSASEVMQAVIAQIERVNPRVNAIVTFLPEQALKAARALDRQKSWDAPLAGLPIAYKDLLATKGIRTTFGSPIYADHVPAENHLLVERLAAAGAITIGKTNTPEFGAGSQTFNAVFGATRNPYDLAKTCGGSSGGAAVPLACGILPFAD